MKKLLWKELYELRLIPVACSALLASIIIACYGFTFWESQHDKMPADLLTIGPTITMLAVAIAIVGLFPGSSAVAPEVGQGTLGFLGLLPGSRTRLWSSKVIAGMVTIVLSLTAVLLIYFVTLLCLFGHTKVSMAIGEFQGWMASYDVPLSSLLLAEIILFGYAVSLFFSTIVDRTVTASVLSFVVVIALGFAVGSIVSAISSNASGEWNDEYILVWIATFLDIAFLASACVAFCVGNALRSATHVRIAFGSLLVWFIIGGLCIAAYVHLPSQRYYTVSSDDNPGNVLPLIWTTPKGYENNFVVPEQKGWTVASTRAVSDIGASTQAIAKIPSDNPDADRTLIHRCFLSQQERLIVVGSPPIYLKDKIESVLKKKPNFFFAQYCLASWYAQNGQWDDYRAWRDRALNNAPAILAGRFQYNDGQPVVNADLNIYVSIYRWNSAKNTTSIFSLNFRNVVTDENGCYYLPVYRGVYNIWNMDHNSIYSYGAENSSGVTAKLKNTMSIQSTDIDYLKSVARVGLIPPLIARPYISLTGTLGRIATSEKNPAALDTNTLDVSWKPYPNADYYQVTLMEFENANGDHMPNDQEMMPSNRFYVGFSATKSAPTSLQLNLSGRNPGFNPRSIYVLHITACRGAQRDFRTAWEENPEQYANSKSFYFIPKAGRGPIPIPHNPFIMD